MTLGNCDVVAVPGAAPV